MNPEKLREEIERQTQEFLKRGGSIKQEPIRSKPYVPPVFNTAIGTATDDGRKRKTTKWNVEKTYGLEVKKCPISRLWHVFQKGKKRSLGCYNRANAEIQERSIRRRIQLGFEAENL